MVKFLVRRIYRSIFARTRNCASLLWLVKVLSSDIVYVWYEMVIQTIVIIIISLKVIKVIKERDLLNNANIP